ncbi:MAG: VWA domain-containing protein [Candidatus Omnitrophica bacterium]|nr:VWA domain-containing protein [Candidatus Omnitrophota bacterium]
MIREILYNPVLPQIQIFSIWVVLVALALLNVWRLRGTARWHSRFFLTLLRVGVISGLCFLLLRPMEEINRGVFGQRPVFTILVDTSKSMDTKDCDERSRIDVVSEHLREGYKGFLNDLSRSFDIRYAEFSEEFGVTTLGELAEGVEPKGEKSDLNSALVNAANSLQGRQTAGMLLVSDGRDNETGEVASAASYLKSLNLPVWSTTVGATGEAKDVFLSARINQSFLFKEQEGQIQVDLSQTGYKGWYVQVELLREGEPVGLKQVMFKSGAERVTFPVKEENKGTYKYTVRAEPLHEESDPGNNERSVFVRVVDDRTKVLVVEAQPYWDSKFMLRTLQADPNLEVTSIFYINKEKIFAVTQRDSNKDGASESVPSQVRLPKTKEELFQYDCVILGKDIDSVFSAEELKLFKDYLEERGGSLVYARGKSYTFRNEVLAELEPVVWGEGEAGEGRFQLTSAGSVNPIFEFGPNRNSDLVIRELPEMVSVTRVKEEKSLAVILARTQEPGSGRELATIAYERYGKGKVMSIGTAGLWRWSFMPRDLSEYDDVYARFWGQMIRWLVYGSDFLPGQDITFKTDKNSFSLGEPVPLVIQTKLVDRESYHPRIELTAPDGTIHEVVPTSDEYQPTLFSARYLPDKEGEYTAVLHNNLGEPKEDTVRFTVYSDSVEQRFVSSNEDLMAQISSITGGESLSMDEWNTLPQRARDFTVASAPKVEPEDIWDKLSIFSLLMGVLGFEWLLRRKAGLL